MSGDEVFALLVTGVLAWWSWIGWYLNVNGVSRLGAPSPGKGVMLLWPLLCAVVLFVVLKTAASADVRHDTLYLTFYVIFGAGWVGLLTRLLPATGISPRDDVLERGNPAAVPAVAGAILAFTLCFAGGNVGNGPGWWVVEYSAFTSTAVLAALWLGFDALTGVSDTITIERDAAAGVRLGALLVAAGLILGRAVAGDWVSGPAMLRDCAMVGWPALVLFAVALPLERGLRPTPSHPQRTVIASGLVPALLYLAGAIAYVVYLGAV
jgi:hypothetical protein